MKTDDVVIDVPPSAPLSISQIEQAVSELSEVDEELATIARRHGPPPLWARPPGFATIVRIILEQQVSLKAAATIYRRLQSQVGRVTAARLALCDVDDLRAAGITGSKSSYIIGLAQAVIEGFIDLPKLAQQSDDEVRESLTRLRGIGPWTSDVYLLMVLRRPDIWPVGDLALAISVQRVKGLRKRPTDARMLRMAKAWRPWRSVAARLLWQDYLAIQRKRA
jgi:DNA-3-methyladenine glycosylase II